MLDKIEKKRLAILRILKDSTAPLTGRMLTERLTAMGYDMSERTVRFHLLALDRGGLTECVGRHGRRITEKGLKEASRARVYEKVGFLTAKIDRMTYRMNFNLEKLEGTVVVNVSLVPRDRLLESCPLISRVFKAGLSMGTLLALFPPGDQVGDLHIPDTHVGVGTVCSMSLNGVLLSDGIPVTSRFGGILEMEDNHPQRFIHIIRYDGTSLDPLEIFIRSGMTDYLSATTTGNGLVGASFRELPAESRERAAWIVSEVERIGLGTVVDIGFEGQPLCEVPIGEGLVGMIVMGGLNPLAIVEESGIRIDSNALSGLVDFRDLFPYGELAERTTQYV